MDPEFPLVWRLVKKCAGSGAAGDLGSHIIGLAHFLIGDMSSIHSSMRTFVRDRPLLDDPSRSGRVDVDDAI